MKCEEARKRWHRRWDDGTIDAQLDQHLDQCESCRRYSDEMSRVTNLLGQLRRDTDSIVSQRADASTISTRLSLGSSVRRWVRPVIGMAAAIMLVATASTFFTSETPRPVAAPGVVSNASTPLGMTLQGEMANRYLVVATPVAQSNVQVFRLYQTFK